MITDKFKTKFYSFMALFGFNCRRCEMLMSVCFACLCNWTHVRKLRCIGNFNRYIPMITDIRAPHVMPAFVFNVQKCQN